MKGGRGREILYRRCGEGVLLQVCVCVWGGGGGEVLYCKCGEGVLLQVNGGAASERRGSYCWWCAVLSQKQAHIHARIKWQK